MKAKGTYYIFGAALSKRQKVFLRNGVRMQTTAPTFPQRKATCSFMSQALVRIDTLRLWKVTYILGQHHIRRILRDIPENAAD